MNINFDKLWLTYADGLSQQQNRTEKLENLISSAIQDSKDFQNKYMELYQGVRDIRDENDNLKGKIKELEYENANDYKDLRKFQNKYIESDQNLQCLLAKYNILNKNLDKYKSALSKIAYIENEWDDPADLVKDLKDIAKEALEN